MKKFSMFLCSALMVFGFVTSAYSYSFSGLGSEYQLIEYTGTWTDALTGAQAIGPGWNLAGISSEAEQNFIASQLLFLRNGTKR